MKFKKEFLVDELGLPDEAIEDNIYDTRRWSEDHEIIFEYDNKFYQCCYSCGATEMQDESPWEYEDEVDCTEVIQKEILVKKWIKKEK